MFEDVRNGERGGCVMTGYMCCKGLFFVCIFVQSISLPKTKNWSNDSFFCFVFLVNKMGLT